MAELEERWAELKREVKGDLLCIDAYKQASCTGLCHSPTGPYPVSHASQDVLEAMNDEAAPVSACLTKAALLNERPS